MADVTVRSDQFRRTPEDVTVPVFTVPDPDDGTLDVRPGGAANVATNLRAMGCAVSLLAVGDGLRGFGPALTRVVAAAGVDATRIVANATPAAGTTTKVRFVEGGRLVGRVDFDYDAAAPVLPPLADPVRLPAAVVLCDHARGSITQTSARAWVRWAHARGVVVYADPKVGRQGVWDGTPVDVMVANHLEACGSRAGIPDVDQADDKWARALAAACRSGWGPFRVMVIKRGPYGSAWATNDDGGPRTGLVPPVDPQQVFDVCGAGDTYLAGLVTARCLGADLPDACLFASAAAGVAVGQRGTAVVSAADAVAALRPVVGTSRGVLTRDAAAALAARLRAWQFRVVLTCGCYRLLTPGHVASLRAAAAAGDFLLVAVDSDDKVRELKGEVVVPGDARVDVVAGVAGIGAAFLFEESLGRLIQTIKPAVVVKGCEYAPAEVVGAEHLAAWGGRLDLTPMVDAEHNRDLIARIRKSTIV